jgi:hypothetical protein
MKTHAPAAEIELPASLAEEIYLRCLVAVTASLPVWTLVRSDNNPYHVSYATAATPQKLVAQAIARGAFDAHRTIFIQHCGEISEREQAALLAVFEAGLGNLLRSSAVLHAIGFCGPSGIPPAGPEGDKVAADIGSAAYCNAMEAVERLQDMARAL